MFLGTRDVGAAWLSTFGTSSSSKPSTCISRLQRSNTFACRSPHRAVQLPSSPFYRPGSSAPDASFFGEFTTILESLATFNSQLVILGDLNVHLENPGDGACITLNGILDSFSLVQHVNSPTHSAGGLLDVIITRSDCTISNPRVDPLTISDHDLIACPASPVFTSRRVRGWKRLDRDRFRGALSAGPLCQDEDYYDGMSASELFDVYTSTIRETPDRLVPLHDIVSRFRPSTPRFDAECRSVKRGARLLERRYRRTRNPEDRLAWIHALRSVSTILGERAKQTATHSTFSAAEFPTFLEQKVETIRSDTAGLAPPIFIPTDCSFSSFTPCTQQFVRNLIGSAPSKSCELDPAPTFLIKEFLDTLLPFLTRLCNVSLQEGRLPSSQTTAIVTPALKKHGLDPTDMKNFRPISNLSFMSEIVERIVVRQLSQYLDANGLLPKLQSGFRKTSFHGICPASCAVRPFLLSRQWTDLVTCPPRRQCCIRHGRSCYPTRSTVYFVRDHGISIRLDALFRRGLDTNSSLLWVHLAVCCCAFRSGSRIGAWTSPIRPLHRRHPEAGRIARVQCPSVRG